MPHRTPRICKCKDLYSESDVSNGSVHIWEKSRCEAEVLYFSFNIIVCTFIKSVLGGYITLRIRVPRLSGEHLSQRGDVLRVYLGESDKLKMIKLKNLQGCPDLALYICITSLDENSSHYSVLFSPKLSLILHIYTDTIYVHIFRIPSEIKSGCSMQDG